MESSGPTLTDGLRQLADRCVFRKEGEYWTIVYEGRAIRLKDAKGLHCLAQLLRNPGREFHATDLIGTGDAAADDAVVGEAAAVGDFGDAGKALDARAKAESAVAWGTSAASSPRQSGLTMLGESSRRVGRWRRSRHSFQPVWASVGAIDRRRRTRSARGSRSRNV